MKVNPIEKVAIASIRGNEKNPRFIRDKEFKALVKSVREFPKMMEARPIIVDENNIILGGNMRYKAALELGYKEVHIVKITDATEEQKREFIIKDNVSKGEWDWDMLANDWDMNELEDWGLKIMTPSDDELEEEPEPKSGWYLSIEFTSEQDVQIWYDKLISEGLNCKIVQ